MKNSDIEFLFDLVKNEKIKLVNNSILQKEWNNCKKSQKEKIPQSINGKLKGTRDIQKLYNLNIPEIVPDFSWLDDQINMLDQLLNEDALYLEISEKAKSISADHLYHRKAPFHNKKDSLKDSFIVFSTLEYFKDKQEKIVFISDNHNDFSDEPPNVYEIHPDIVNDYKNVSLEYHHKTGLGLKKLKEKYSEFIPENSIPVKLDEDSFKLNKNLTFEKNLLNFFESTFKNLNYIPQHILINNEVFLNEGDDFGYYENFTISTKNERLTKTIAELVKSYNEDKKNNDLTKGEVKGIIDSLTKNSIYYISQRGFDNPIELPQSSTTGDSISNSINTFDFKGAFSKLENLKENNLDEILFKAYNLFQLGKLKESFQITNLLIKKSGEPKNTLYINIAKYNRSKLSKLFFFNFQEEENVDFDFINDYSKCSNFVEDETVKWLISDSFLYSSQHQLNHLKSKLISSYELVKNGGRTNNSTIQLAYNQFIRYDQFIFRNSIIFDQFSEDTQIKNDFIECLICSLAIGVENSGISGINNYILQVLIKNAETDSILKLLKRYNVKRIAFVENKESPHAKLEELYCNLFEQQAELNEILINEDKTYFFRSKLNKFYSNALILLAYLELDKKDLNKQFKVILECMGGENILQKQTIKHLAHIIGKKGGDLNKINTQKLFELILSRGELHDREILWQSFKLFSKNPKDLSITKKDFNQIKSILFGKCELCNRTHESVVIIDLWQIAEKFKPEIEKHIQNRITSGSDSELHYQAVVAGIVPFDMQIIDKLISRSVSNSDPLGDKLFGIGNNRNFYFLQLIHLVIKYGVDTRLEEFDKIRELGDYYKWLLDPEHFYYDLFYTDWLFNIYNIETLNKLKEIPEIKENLSNDISENQEDKSLLKAFVRLYKDRKDTF